MKFMSRFSAFIVALLLVSGPAASQPRQGPVEAYERQSATAQQLQATVSRAAIEPIVTALKRHAQDDPQMLNLLNRIEFTATPHLMRPANAYATRPARVLSGGRVEIDLGWFHQANSIAMLAATQAIDPKNERGFAYQAGFKYGAELREALLAGRDLPNFTFNIEEHVSDPLELAYVNGLGTRLTDDAMAWTILHEIGHHKLGHLVAGRYDSSNSTSRRLELEADDWAYREMQNIGISHFGALMFMRIMSALDQIHTKVGIGVEESQSTHPSWTTRIARLEGQYDATKATTASKFTTFMTKINTGGAGGQANIKRITYTFPRDPVGFGCLAILQLQGSPEEFAITETRNGQMHLLQAPPGQLIDITIVNPDRTLTQIISTITNRATGAVQQGSLLAWEQPFTLYGEVTKEGIRVGEAMQTSIRSFFTDALRQTTSNPDKQKRALAVLEDKLRSDCDIGQQFGKGQLDMAQMMNRSQSVAQRYTENLKAVLGEQDFARLQSTMMAAPFAQAGLRQLQKILSAPQQ